MVIAHPHSSRLKQHARALTLICGYIKKFDNSNAMLRSCTFSVLLVNSLGLMYKREFLYEQNQLIRGKNHSEEFSK